VAGKLSSVLDSGGHIGQTMELGCGKWVMTMINRHLRIAHEKANILLLTS
jgi:hypothetical protein